MLGQILKEAVIEASSFRVGAGGQDGAEGNMEELSPDDFVEIKRFVSQATREGAQRFNLRCRGRDVITLSVGIEAPATIGGDLGKERGLRPRDDTERFEVARASGLDVQEIAADPANDRIGGKFIRAAVNADLVGAAKLCDGHMLTQ